MKKRTSKIESSSFRDPSGFIFFNKNTLYRQINKIAKKDFDLLINSGLYENLTKRKLLISHKKAAKSLALTKEAYEIIKPEVVPFISYPYEWSFSQLKSAALLTLKVQKIALEHGMTLKDASSYNIQFIGFKPVFIDTLSFEEYKVGHPWIAYRQFCQHFLSPLALMAKKDLQLNLLLKNFIDGIPLSLASKLLPLSTKFSFSLFTHIHLHALNQKRMANKKIKKEKLKMTKFQMNSFLLNLESTIRKLNLKNYKTEWEKYYSFTNYSKKAFQEKEIIFDKFLKKIKPKSVLDLGANTGKFSQIASKNKAYTISCDIDHLAVEKNYSLARKDKNKLLLSMIVDLTNPSPSLGWANKERASFTQRANADCVLAFALIHHLAISNNLPFKAIADYFSSLGKWLIIEFVEKKDSKVKILLQNREDIFQDYSKESFEKAFLKHYKIIDRKKIKKTKREIYLMRKK